MGTSADGLANDDSKQQQQLFSFGVVSDVQYADIPDGHSPHGVPRYYRHSILVLQRAVESWNNNRSNKLSFAMNFGDIIDGYCPRDQSLDVLKKVVREFENFHGPVYHMIGNHCLYNLPRDKLLPLLNIPNLGGDQAYYEFSPTPEYRFVVLDGFDISTVGWPQDHPNHLEAIRFLEEKNPNSNKDNPEGLVGLDIRFVKLNGGVGRQQMEWLDGVLDAATNYEQKVIVCCHLPLYPVATFKIKAPILWNYEQVLDLIHRYRCVKVCLAGHYHEGGYAIDSHGVHHRVLEAALECPPGTDSFGYIDVYDDMLSLVGKDRMKSTNMSFN